MSDATDRCSLGVRISQQLIRASQEAQEKRNEQGNSVANRLSTGDARRGSRGSLGLPLLLYAADFIGKHLQGVAGGKTYSQVSSAAIALSSQIASTPKTAPSYATLQSQLATLNGQKATLFQGEMLRGTLLNAWGWWTLGVYTTYAGIGLLVAALGVLGALVFELVAAGRRPESIKVKVGQRIAA